MVERHVGCGAAKCQNARPPDSMDVFTGVVPSTQLHPEIVWVDLTQPLAPVFESDTGTPRETNYFYNQ